MDLANLPSRARWFAKADAALEILAIKRDAMSPPVVEGFFYWADLFQLAVPRQVSKRLNRGKKMDDNKTVIDLDFRPRGYFWPLDLGVTPHAFIKGAERRAMVERMYADGREDEIAPELMDPVLSDAARKALGSIHPSFMGGEYLPSLGTDEVEVARISIASTTQDVTCVYARREGEWIYYRVVDEYEGSTLDGPAEKQSKQPLTLKELTDFFLDTWDLRGVLEINFGDYGMPEDRVIGFVTEASSLYYPEFGALIFEYIDSWLAEVERDDEEDER